MPNRTFIRWNDYQAKKHTLEQQLKAIEGKEQQVIPESALDAFDEFFNLTERHYPLLLSVGEPFTLEQKPSAVYLLPKAADMDHRILVVQMPKKPGGDARLELYEWQPSKAIPEPPYERQDAQIKPWNSSNDSKQPFSIKIEDTDFDLNERPLRINAINLSKAMLVFELEFKQGRLIVAAPPKQENATASWSALNEDRSIVQVERTSSNKMPDIIHYRRGLEDKSGWQDDQILTLDGKPLKIAEPIGRIKGVDGSIEDGICFIATNDGRVIQLDLKPQVGSNKMRFATVQGCAKEPKDTFDGSIEDVIILPKKERNLRALAACYNGKLYVIEADEKEVKVVAEQRAEHLHINRVMPDTEGEILAIDQHHSLFVLRLNEYETHNAFKHKAVNTLSSQLPLKTSSTKTAIYNKMLMHAWIGQLNAENNPFKHDLCNIMQGLKAKLAEASLSSYERQQATEHYYALFKMLQRTFEGSFYRSLAKAKGRNEIIENVFSWLQLPKNTPDWLWLKLFREWDRAEYAISILPATEKNDYAIPLKRLRQHIYQKRQQLAQQAQKLRPISTIASTRMPGYAKHIRRLGQSPQGNQRFVCTAYAHGLFAYELIQQNKDTYFQQLAHCDGKQANQPQWQGRITTITTEIRNHEQNDHLLFIATHRGECHLLELNNNKFIEISKTDIPLECATSHFVAYKAGNKTKCGFLVAGSTPDEKASIYWLELQPNSQFGNFRRIYHSKEKGRIRMLAHDPERQNDLWGIDEEQGLLLHWHIDLPATESSHSELKNATVLYRSGEPLHALYLTKDQKQPKIVCGGHDGMAISLSPKPENHGQLMWHVGGGSAVRCLREVQTFQGKLFVLAGDTQHVLLYDSYGRLTGMVENIGPISAIATLKQDGADSTLLLSSKSGRLLALSLKPSTAQIPCSLPDDPIAYPLRQPPNPGTWEQEQIKQLLRSKEALLFQQGLAAFWQYLQTSSDISELKPFEQKIRLRHQDQEHPQNYSDGYPHRTALAIRQPSNAAHGNTQWQANNSHQLEALLTWLNIQWQKVNTRSGNDRLCQITEGILFVAEQHTQHTKLHTLVKEISDCIWAHIPPNNACSKNLYFENRLRLMRLSQAMRVWCQVTIFDGQQGNEAILNWINQLTTLWGGTPETWQTRLDWLMQSQHPFAAPSKSGEYSWLDWLKSPRDSTAIQHLGLKPLHQWPKPFVWDNKEKEHLSQIFKQPPSNNEKGRSASWSDWVNELSDHMDAVIKARNAEFHFAWKEENALHKLSDHLTVVANQQFTPENGLALAALVWRTFCEDWISNIKHRIEELHDLGLHGYMRYLDVWSDYHWRDEHSVEITLRVRFRGTRSLLIEYAQHASKQIILSAPRMFSIKAEEGHYLYKFTLTTDKANELDAEIELVCHDFRGISFTRRIPLQDQRGLAGFRRAEDSWSAQAEKLMRWLDIGSSFDWLCGPDWPQQEHERLKAIVRDRYAPAYGNIKFINTLENALTQNHPLFVPGFNLEPNKIALPLHALLHQQHKEGLNPLALAIWLWAKSSNNNNAIAQTSESIWQILKKQIPGPKSEHKPVEDLLNKLLYPEQQQALQEFIQGYPAANVISWSCGGILQQQAQRPWLGDLGITAWQSLLDSHLSHTELAVWSGVAETDIGQLEQHISSIKQTNNAPVLIQALAHALLPNVEINTANTIPVLIHPMDVMHRTWKNIYIVPKGITLDSTAQQQPEGLWLLLQHKIPQTLPGTQLSLNSDQILSLLTTGSPQASQQRLNRIAGIQLPVNPHDVFQDKGGLHPNIISRSFHGRQKALTTLTHTIQQGGTVLTVGGRKAGKTALITRLELDLRQEEPSVPWVTVTGVSVPEYSKSEKKAFMLRWFLNELRNKFNQQGQSIRYDWKDIANTKQHGDALAAFKQRLADISHAQGRPVILLDETLPLLQADIQNHHQIGKLLRSWVDEHLVTVIATAYPYGSDKHPSLFTYKDIETPDNPWFNFFSQGVVKLEPWSPQETWEFLAPRLAGFGLILPVQFAQSLLDLTRGIPWIAQNIGIALCNRPNQHSTQITKGDWDNAVQQTRQEVYNQLKDTVRAVANDLDIRFGHEQNASLFGRGNLWRVLTDEAARATLSAVSLEAKQWPKANLLNVRRIQRNLGEAVSEEALQAVLVALSESGLLEGQDNNSRFIFWNDLLPAFVKEG